MKVCNSLVFAVLAFSVSTSALSQDKSSGSSQHSGHMSGAASHGDVGASKAPYELQFLDTMAAHHQSGIEMAQMVESRSAHDELKQMAKKSIEDQQKEIKQLQDWKQQWYAGKSDAVNMQMPGMKESMQGMGSKMKKMEAANGQAFDAMFIDVMTKHHQDGIKMARNALPKLEHQEVKDMANKIIKEQTSESARLAAWKKE